MPDIVYNWQNVEPNVDNDLFTWLFLDVVDGTQKGTKTVRATFVALFLGDSKIFSLLNESFLPLGLRQQDCIETTWLHSTMLFWTNINITAPVDEILLDRQPQSDYLKMKSGYVKKPISKEGLEGIWKKMIELVDTKIYFIPFGGRINEIPSTATPFPHRAGNLWMVEYLANWYQPGKEVADYYIDLARKLHKYLPPFVSKNQREAFFNNKDFELGINHNGKNSYVEGRVYGEDLLKITQIVTEFFSNKFEKFCC